jgi:hypothetical protein
MVSGFVGGPAGTNYGENISTIAITKVFSIPVLAVAAIIAMVISFFTPLIQGIYAIPLAVIGGLEVYLFGAIAAQGIAIMIDKKVDMFSARNIAVISTIMIIGLARPVRFRAGTSPSRHGCALHRRRRHFRICQPPAGHRQKKKKPRRQTLLIRSLRPATGGLSEPHGRTGLIFTCFLASLEPPGKLNRIKP